MRFLFLLLLFPVSVYADFNEEFYEYEKVQFFNEFQDEHEVHILSGNSVEHLGLYDGDLLKLYHRKVCNIGDICSFTCLVDKCKNGEDDTFLKQIENVRFVRDTGLYFTFAGRPGAYPCLGEEHRLCESFDSTFFGELLYGRDFVFVGRLEL